MTVTGDQQLQKSDRAADVRSRLMLVTLCLIWGMTWPMMKISLTEIPPLSMRTMTAAIGGVALFAICLFKRRSLRVSTARDWVHIFVASFFNISAFSLFTAFAQIQAATSRVAILTYTLPIWTLLLAWLVSMMGSMTGARAKFRNVFSLMASCSLIQALQSIAVYIVVRAKGDEIRSVEQLTPPFGLDIFLQDLHGTLFAVVNFFSIFEIWYIVVLGVGLAALAKSSKGKAFAAITPAWVLPLLLRMIQLAFTPGGSSS